MWTADKIYFQGSSAYTRAYQGSELVWEYTPPIDFTKYYWWHNNDSVFYTLPTRWNNNYYVEFDYQMVANSDNKTTTFVGSGSGNIIEIAKYSSYGVYCDIHYPNSTVSATTNTTDYDQRFKSYSGTSSKNPWKKGKNTMTVRPIGSGLFKVVNHDDETTVINLSKTIPNQNFCTTQDYKLKIYALIKNLYFGDVRVYNNEGTMIHNFQLYPYVYYDRVTGDMIGKTSITDVIHNDR